MAHPLESCVLSFLILRKKTRPNPRTLLVNESGKNNEQKAEIISVHDYALHNVRIGFYFHNFVSIQEINVRNKH